MVSRTYKQSTATPCARRLARSYLSLMNTAPSYMVPVQGNKPRQFACPISALQFAWSLQPSQRVSSHDKVVTALNESIRFNNRPARGTVAPSLDTEGFATLTVSL